MFQNYLQKHFTLANDETFKNHTFSMTFLKNIHKKRRTGPTPNKILNKYPRKLIADSLHARFVDFFKNIIVKSINFENLNLTRLNSHLLIHIFFNSKLLSSLIPKNDHGLTLWLDETALYWLFSINWLHSC